MFKISFYVILFGFIILLFVHSYKSKSDNKFPVHHCVSVGDIEELEKHIAAKYNFTQTTNNQIAPIHCLIQCPIEKQEKILSLLISAGVNIEQRNANGFTTLQLAACNKKSHLMYLLLKYGANSTIVNEFNLNAKELAKRTSNMWLSINPILYKSLTDSVNFMFDTPFQANASKSFGTNSKTNITKNKSAFFFKTDTLVIITLFIIALLIFIHVGNEMGKLLFTLKYIFLIVSAIGFVWQVFITNFFIERGSVPSFSMFPYADNNTHLVIDKFTNKSKYQLRDVLAINTPLEHSLSQDSYILKRLIARAGDKIKVTSSKLLIDSIDITKKLCNGIPLHAWLKLKLNKKPNEIMHLSNFEILKQTSKVLGINENRISLIPGELYINGQKVKEEYIAEDMDYELKEFVVPKDYIFVLGDNRNKSLDCSIYGCIKSDLIIGRVIYKFQES